MKRIFFPAIAAIAIVVSVTSVSAQLSRRDTLQTFTFGSPSQAKYLFPPLSEKYEKILMHYKLRCPTGGACGEWDYLMYIWLYEHTGKLDSAKNEIINRYEIGRYITPYGNGLTLGKGFTWTYDVSDYRSLLHDSVDLSAYNQQEQVDITFEFIHGTPPREPISVQNLWNGNIGYSPKAEDSWLNPLRVKIPDDALNTRIKMRPTGHGFGDQENCAEFCPKDHWILVNGDEIYRRKVFREDCGLNPVYPQGGTWVYNRTNWCPGSDVETYDVELSPYVKPGDSVTLKYNVEPYTSLGGGTSPYYDLETQLIPYGKPNFKLDAAIERIKSPSTEDIFKRHNPICGNPQITIKNNGTTTLNSLDITYGIIGAPMKTYHWVGNLAFLEQEDVDLGRFSWASDSKRFQVKLSNPNGGTDDYLNDDIAESDFVPPSIYPSKIFIEYKTNSAPEENSYELLDANGSVILSKDQTLEPNTTYRDTATLADGCYTFIMHDEGANGSGDGLSWWANTGQGSGTIRIRKGAGGTILKSFGADFGKEIYQQFGVGTFSGVAEHNSEDLKLDIFPNPAPKKFTVDITEPYVQDFTVSVFDMLGDEVYHAFRNGIAGDKISVDLTGNIAGTYVVRVASEAGVISKMVIIE